MSEEPRIEAPRSLLERAGLGLGRRGLKPAPVPRDLAAPVNRRATRQRSAADQPAAGETGAARAEPSAPAFARLDLAAGEPHPIDRERLARHGLIQPEGAVTTLLEEFRIVKRQVLAAVGRTRQAGQNGLAQRVLVTSPLPDEGKTFCAANLALAVAAEKDSEVLLVDADFAKPSLLSLFGLPRGRGFMDLLANERLAIDDCVLATDIAGLYVLPAGNHTNSDSEFLASHRTADLLDRLTAGAPNRLVIFDSPPALAATPAAELARHVGQTIVVVRADRTGQTALEDALTLLSACPELKLLLNAAHFSPSGRRFGVYYGHEGEG